MAVFIDIRATGVGPLIASLKRFGPRVSEPAAANALNRTVNKMRKEARAVGARTMGVKKGQLTFGRYSDSRPGQKMGGLKTIRARARRRSSATLVVRGRPHNLIKFGAVATKGGVIHSAWGRVTFGKGLVIVNGAWVGVPDPNGVPGRRIMAWAYGPGLAQTLAEPGASARVERVGVENFERFYVAAANHQLSRAGYRGRLGR